MYDRKKIRSAQNVTDVSFFVVIVAIPGSAGLILNCGIGDIKSGSSWDGDGRRSLVKGLASQ